MCGRFTQATDAEIIARVFELPTKPVLSRRYNIAPTQYVAAVRAGASGRELANLQWGLVPSWASSTSSGASMINARSETVTTKPAFRDAFRLRRCLIVADGFYEWQKIGKTSQPYYVCFRDQRPFGFAGLWERWEREGTDPVESCTILVTNANDLVAPIHDRMPVILDPPDHKHWIDPKVRDPERLLPLLRPYDPGMMEAYPVSPLVNNSANDLAGCRMKLGK